jgi:MFS family permease
MTALILTYLSSFLMFGSNNVVTTATPGYVLYLGGSLPEAGLQNTVFILSAIVLRFIFAPFVDRLGIKRVMLVGALAFCVTTPLFFFCESFWQVVALRCVQAIGLAAFMPCASTFVTLNAPQASLGSAVGTFRIFTTASLMVGPPLAFPLIEAVSYGFFFIIMGAASVLGLILLLLIPNKSAQNSASLDKNATQPPPTSPAQASVSRLHVIAKNAPVLITQLVIALAYSSVFIFGKLFMETKFPTLNSGILFAFISLGGIVAGLVVGRLQDKKGMAPSMILSLAALASSYLIFAHSGTVFTLIPAALLCGLGYYGCTISAIGSIGTRTQEQDRGFVISQQQNCLDLGLAFGSLLFGILPFISGSSATVFTGIAVALFISTLIWVAGSIHARRALWKQ